MKNTLLLFASFLFGSVSVFAGGGCVIDTTNTQFFNPRPDSLPCVERNVPYDEVIQIAIPASINLQDFGAPFPFILYVDSVVITGVNGLPTGLSYSSNPANGTMYGGEKGCAQLYGNTSDPAGHYPVYFIGTFTAHGQAFPPYFDGDTTLDFATLQSQSQGRFDLFVDVIEQGAECRPASGIGNLNSELNALIKIYPNPSTGVFEFSLNTGRRITGEMVILDMNGRKVFSRDLDANGLYVTSFDLSNSPKGLYNFLLKTNEGVASKNISLE